ncbi:hypothetical protein [Hymenobacter nivis]|nr:hypothetical protein [Hymenobacter nivis]
MRLVSEPEKSQNVMQRAAKHFSRVTTYDYQRRKDASLGAA